MTVPSEDILFLVEKPGRYTGSEVNSVKKDRSRCRLFFALAFPDVYEIGMSHLGMQILYAVLNGVSEISAERFYAPWPDMEFLMRKNNILLSSLESGAPLKDFDIVGFSLQYELSYTNVLNMLELGGITVRAGGRKEGEPLVIAGGPCVFNPAPVSAFFDAFVIGEGEEVVTEISRVVMKGKERKSRRKQLLESLAVIEGVYVPSVHLHGERIRKRIIPDINSWTVPLKPVVPLIRAVHDHITLEIARGCTRGCRFCQAGMVWRPLRERRPDVLEKMAEAMLSSTGHDELSLLSLSTGDYSLIERLLAELMNRYYHKKVAVSLPSMRVETLSRMLIDEIKKVRKTSFTLAPEAGTQRLRDIINKGNTEDDLILTARRVFKAGWRSIKLYFMIGLPGEKEEDLEGIVDLAYRVFREGGSARQVTVNLSTFIPKPHTPFQWVSQIDLDEIHRRQEFFKKGIRNRNINIKWHEGHMSLIEGIFSRGDERLGPLLEEAFRLGCRFDGWGNKTRFDLWEQAMRRSGIRAEDYLRQRDIAEDLPWDRIDCGISKEFLLREFQRSLKGDLTADCRSGACHNCGVCDGDNVKIITTEGEAKVIEKIEEKPIPAPARRLRVRFAKGGISRFLSHLEISAALIRGMRRGGVSFIYSGGFHPHPKISFPYATSVGMESLCEYADIEVEDPGKDMEKLAGEINAFLPAGLQIMDIGEISPGTDPLSKTIRGFTYDIILPGKVKLLDEKIDAFLKTDEFIISREKKGGRIKKDIRPFVETIIFDGKDNRIRVSSFFGKDGGVRPFEILTHILGLDCEVAKRARVIKTDTTFDFHKSPVDA